MMRTKTCPKCQASMAEGFIPSEKHGMPALSGWIAGAPKKGWWGDVKLPGKPIPIATFRCNRCGFLEHYASGKGAD